MNIHKDPKALVCPLDWGLGHASRCVPVIRELLGQGFQVTIAASGRSLEMLRNEFPGIPAVVIKGFSPKYSGSDRMVARMVWLLPVFIYYMIAENIHISRLIKIQNFDLIISDNRYGIFHRSAYNILIIHQIRIKSPAYLKWLEPLLLRVNRILFRNFDNCWIPDYEGRENLSGELSHVTGLPLNYEFIGPLSRFSDHNLPQIQKEDFILAVLSGPEPQRTILEQKILDQSVSTPYRYIVVQGTPENKSEIPSRPGLTILPFISGEKLRLYLQTAALIICRSGYSTIMDLACIGGKALFIPTPGQTEQEYLAEKLHTEGIAHYVKQQDMDLKRDIRMATEFTGFTPLPGNNLLSNKIASLKSALIHRFGN